MEIIFSMGLEFQFCKIKRFWRSVTQQYELHLTLLAYTFKMANFILRTFYHNFKILNQLYIHIHTERVLLFLETLFSNRFIEGRPLSWSYV